MTKSKRPPIVKNMKYPNTKIATYNNGNSYYVSFGSSLYLNNKGDVMDWGDKNLSTEEKNKLVSFPTKESAQQALTAYNNMNKTRDYAALKQEGIDKNLCGPPYIYLGKGSIDNPLSVDWDTNDIYRIERNGTIDKTNWAGDLPSWGYCTSELIWNKKFPTKKKEITLSEIKSQYEEAKKLVGKKIKRLIGYNAGLIHNVDEVNLHLENPPKGELHNKFFAENGYVISLHERNMHEVNSIFMEGAYQMIEEIVVKNHSGQPYTAKNEGDFWVFGCARIDKSLLKAAYNLLNDKATTKGNRSATKVTIGAADFDLETLKKLVEAT